MKLKTGLLLSIMGFGLFLGSWKWIGSQGERAMKRQNSSQQEIQVRPFARLPAVDLGWISLKDHFIATVGPHSGRGEALKNLLVAADATLKPDARFPMHPHGDMEILTWVARGTLHHKDNKGSEQFVPSLSLQLMSARDGIFHAEGNSGSEDLRLLQIWIRPHSNGGIPEVRHAPLIGEGFQLMAGPKQAPLVIRQDLWLYAAKLDGRQDFEVPSGQFGYAVFFGKFRLGQKELADGDGVVLDSGKFDVTGTGQVVLLLQNQ